MSKGWEACTMQSASFFCLNPAWQDRTDGGTQDAPPTTEESTRGRPESDPSEMFGNVEAWNSKKAGGAGRARARQGWSGARCCLYWCISKAHTFHARNVHLFFSSDSALTLSSGFHESGYFSIWIQTPPLFCVIITGNDQVEPRARTQNEFSDSFEFILQKINFGLKCWYFFIQNS